MEEEMREISSFETPRSQFVSMGFCTAVGSRRPLPLVVDIFAFVAGAAVSFQNRVRVL